MTCTTVIQYNDNTLKNTYLSDIFLLDLNQSSKKTYFLRQYIKNTVDNIHHPEFMKQWNYNMDKAEYEFKLEMRVTFTSDRSVIDS